MSGVGGYGGKGRGTRIAKNPKTVEDAAFIRVPGDRDMNGTRTDTNPETQISGHESDPWDSAREYHDSK